MATVKENRKRIKKSLWGAHSAKGGYPKKQGRPAASMAALIRRAIKEGRLTICPPAYCAPIQGAVPLPQES